MSDMIRSAHQRAGLSMVDLAARLGVSESAISQMEPSEREGTIRVTTMNRALEALGHDLLLTSTYLLDEPSFRARADRSPDPGMKRLNILVDGRSFSRA